MANEQPTVSTYIPIESKDNYFAIDLNEGDTVKIEVNGVKATEVVIPYDGKLRCYMVRQKAPSLHYK